MSVLGQGYVDMLWHGCVCVLGYARAWMYECARARICGYARAWMYECARIC